MIEAEDSMGNASHKKPLSFIFTVMDSFIYKYSQFQLIITDIFQFDGILILVTLKFH